MKRKVLVAFAAILMISMLVGTGSNNQVKANAPVIIVGDLCCNNFNGVCDWGDFQMNGAFWVY